MAYTPSTVNRIDDVSGDTIMVVDPGTGQLVQGMVPVDASGTPIDLADFATAAKQDLAKAVFDQIELNQDSQTAILTTIDSVLDSVLAAHATAAKQDLAQAVLDQIELNQDTQTTALGLIATTAKQDLAKAVFDQIELNQDSQTAILVTIDAVLDTIFSGMSTATLQSAQTVVLEKLADALESDNSDTLLVKVVPLELLSAELTVTNTYATVVTPTSGKKVRIRLIHLVNGSASAVAVQLRFATDARFGLVAAPAGTTDQLNYGNGSVVGDTNDVVQGQQVGSNLGNIWLRIFYEEID
jgi:nucleoid DNA-binding protein